MKNLAIVLAMTMALGLAACHKKPDGEVPSTPDDAHPPVTAPASPATH